VTEPAFTLAGIPVRNRVLAAPMCGATKPTYRQQATRFGADLVYTEMVKASRLVRRDPRTIRFVDRAPGETNCAPQISGSDPEVMAEATRFLVEELGFPFVDLNMGCPVRKIVASGAGAALLRDPRQVEAVIAACARAVEVPITVKIRSGWDHKGHADVTDLVRAAEAGGAQLISIHARARSQGHEGEVDTAALARAKGAVSIPIVANGGIMTGEDALELLQRSNCDAVMIGRGAYGRPWIFREAARAIAGQEQLPEPGEVERCDLIAEHLEGMVRYMGPPGVRVFRKYAGWYFQGSEEADEFKRRAYRISDPEEMRELVVEWRAFRLSTPELAV
jgi:tRNA-dihydrouridine synthase B